MPGEWVVRARVWKLTQRLEELAAQPPEATARSEPGECQGEVWNLEVGHGLEPRKWLSPD